MVLLHFFTVLLDMFLINFIMAYKAAEKFDKTSRSVLSTY